MAFNVNNCYGGGNSVWGKTRPVIVTFLLRKKWENFNGKNLELISWKQILIIHEQSRLCRMEVVLRRRYDLIQSRIPSNERREQNSSFCLIEATCLPPYCQSLLWYERRTSVLSLLYLWNWFCILCRGMVRRQLLLTSAFNDSRIGTSRLIDPLDAMEVWRECYWRESCVIL